MRKAVVTGIGVISPNGIGREAFWTATRNAQSGIRTIQRFDTSGLAVTIARPGPAAVTLTIAGRTAPLAGDQVGNLYATRAALLEHALAGDVLFVGSTDMSRTALTRPELYYLVPELREDGDEVIGVDNLSKYGRLAKSYDYHARYRFVEGAAKARIDGACASSPPM